MGMMRTATPSNRKRNKIYTLAFAMPVIVIKMALIILSIVIWYGSVSSASLELANYLFYLWHQFSFPWYSVPSGFKKMHPSKCSIILTKLTMLSFFTSIILGRSFYAYHYSISFLDF